jgi:hypothetical protein
MLLFDLIRSQVFKLIELALVIAITIQGFVKIVKLAVMVMIQIRILNCRPAVTSGKQHQHEKKK